MEELSEQPEQKEELESNTLETKDEITSCTEKSVPNVDSLEQSNQAKSDTSLEKNQVPPIVVESSSPMKTKESVAGTKVKRKARSTRRKLNAMVSNASLHFSDTDSEGELTTISSQVRVLCNVTEVQAGPIISVTSDDIEAENSVNEPWNLMSPDGMEASQRNSFIDNLTDVDEIYASETENEQKEFHHLETAETHCQGETDLEDFEGDDEIQTMIDVEPRADIFCDYSGETIMTKEGDGPFSVEVRNKMYLEETRPDENPTPDIMVLPTTDEEDMAVSDEEDVEEAGYNQKDLPEDLDVLAASQIIMKNMNKMENMLSVKDFNDDASSDCHTDVEDVE